MANGIVQKTNDEDEEDTQKDRYLTFALENEFYALEIRHVTEIIGMQPITQIPELPEYIRGIINLRGKIIPVMDVRLKFKKEFVTYNDRTCIIVIEEENMLIGLIVDSVSEVLSIPDSEIVEPPALSRQGSRYVNGIGKVNGEIKLILDCSKLLNEEDIDLISEMN